jgi:hypothetical protein
VHRVLVVDDKCFLHGLISSLDFVRLYAGDAASTRLPDRVKPAKVRTGAAPSQKPARKPVKVGKKP